MKYIPSLSLSKQSIHSFLRFGVSSLLAIALLNGSHLSFAAGIVGNGSPASCTDAALITALSGGGTVTFNCGSAAKTILFGNEKIITADTTIDGGNLISLSGGNSTRLFSVKPGVHFTLNNLTVMNGLTTGQGGAVHGGMYQNTVLNINHCNFLNNVSTITGEAGGGAIFSSAGAVNVDKSTFTGNKAGVGGAIRVVQSNLTVTGSTFTNNKAIDPTLGDGGAIHIDGGKTDNGKIIIRSSTFTGNTASNYGGAVFNNILNNNTTAITDSVFTGNSDGIGGVNGQGGAIWSTGDPKIGGQWVINKNNTTLTIVNTVVKGNSATKIGGGLFVARHPKGAVISRSTFSDNTALMSVGGGIAQAENGKLSVMNSTISNNTVKGATALGAGIFVQRTSKAFLTNITVANNTANWQAGGISGGLNVTLKNSILANNIAMNGGNNWNVKHNCFEPMTNGGRNLQFPKPIDTPCTAGILIADPILGPLANNGGLTPTRALLPGSPASRLATGCPVTDQRGVIRPNPVGTNCDSGAFEAGF
ncbi:MAG: hypothetical protein IPN42_16520 [Methylococcaceae bacterium]|nr:hypothetical protein [Methylococcaceae bacterium]